MKCRIINYAVDLNYNDIERTIDQMTSEGAFIRRPVGIVNKDYYFIYNNLSRNIGSNQHTFDGFGSPISTLGEIDFNQLYGTPWFEVDSDKKRFANYLDYASGTYGGLLSFMDGDPLDSTLRSVHAASVSNFDIIGAADAMIAADGQPRDTYTGVINGYIAGRTLKRAAVENTARQSARSYGSITSDLYRYFSMSVDSVETDSINKYFTIGRNGRWTSNPATELLDFRTDDPSRSLEIINYTDREFAEDETLAIVGNYGATDTLGVYSYLFDASTEQTQEFIVDALTRNRYYPEIESDLPIAQDVSNFAYLPYLLGDSGTLVEDIQGRYIRYEFDKSDIPSGVYSPGVLNAYHEDTGESWLGVVDGSRARFGSYRDIPFDTNYNDLINKTNANLKEGLYQTLMARFHSDIDDVDIDDQTQTAISRRVGLSRGRNLLSRYGNDSSQGYDNPYCRVWTFHHQYSTYQDTIRPLTDQGQEWLANSRYNWKHFRATHRIPTTVSEDGTLNYDDHNFNYGSQRLDEKGVMDQTTGLINITPVRDKDTDRSVVDIKNCMFSIENLAWKGAYRRNINFDEFGLSEDQMGPFGGRIMWFPPYNLKFDENVNSNWNETQFIGRGEKIYTYTDTERSARLSFTLLIDHPAILDYWTRSTETDTTGDVDDIGSKEQELLRFFAGCDILSARALNPKTKVIEREKKIVSADTVPVLEGKGQKITFFVFFPYNYSGVDDMGMEKTQYVNAVEYVLNGIGTSVTKTGTTGETDLGTHINKNWTYNSNPVGGYEIHPNYGLSIVTEGGSGSTVVYVNEKSEQVSTSDGSGYLPVMRLQGNVQVEKEVTSKGGGESGTKRGRRKKKKKEEHKTKTVTEKRYKWWYRVDKSLRDVNTEPGNFIDKTSYGLNAKGYWDVLASSAMKDENDTEVVSFADYARAMTSSFDQQKNVTTEDGVNKITELIKNHNIIGIRICGSAGSNEGSSDSTRATIGNNRAKAVQEWIRGMYRNSEYASKLPDGGWEITNEVQSCSDKDSNSKSAKLARYAKVDIVFDAEASAPVQETYTETNTNVSEGASGASGSNETENQVVGTSVSGGGSNFTGTWEAIETATNSKNPFMREILGLEPSTNTNSTLAEVTTNGAVSEVVADQVAIVASTQKKNAEITAVENNICRYDMESKFFTLLEEKDSIMYHKISDKIKYFNPAFHSITPEGFNARLTFLHQCTRQGPTIGATDNLGIRTANNLSFGRPPVCVLRIGDFFYTKIIIDSLSINYETNGGLQWDLNQEGIGVMPSMAEVTLNFKFIGGSDLAGPIARLQNATSFNFYANTGVYDNRAEIADFDDNGNITNFKPFVPRIN